MSDHQPEIRIIGATQWREYRDIRLRALAEAPYAFGTTYAEASARGDEVWRDRFLAPDHDRWLPLAAVFAGKFVGLAWGYRSDDSRTVEIFQMWVAPAFRGRGVGVALLSRIECWARSIAAQHLRLGVMPGNDAALALYQRYGFTLADEPPDEDGERKMTMALR